MAKVQTRRTISFSFELVELIKVQARKDRVSLAQWVSELTRKELTKRGVKVPRQWFGPTRTPKRRTRPTRDTRVWP